MPEGTTALERMSPWRQWTFLVAVLLTVGAAAVAVIVFPGWLEVIVLALAAFMATVMGPYDD